MNQELTNKLYANYPKLYRDHDRPPIEYSKHELTEGHPLFMSLDELRWQCVLYEWGIVTGDGWYDLIDRLSAKLTALDLPDLRVLQVKQKLGHLCFYVAGDNDAAGDLIRAAYEESKVTCEACGRPGKQRKEDGSGWIYVSCDAHIQEAATVIRPGPTPPRL